MCTLSSCVPVPLVLLQPHRRVEDHCTYVCRTCTPPYRFGHVPALWPVDLDLHHLALDDLRLLLDAHPDGLAERLCTASKVGPCSRKYTVSPLLMKVVVLRTSTREPRGMVPAIGLPNGVLPLHGQVRNETVTTLLRSHPLHAVAIHQTPRPLYRGTYGLQALVKACQPRQEGPLLLLLLLRPAPTSCSCAALLLAAAGPQAAIPLSKPPPGHVSSGCHHHQSCASHHQRLSE